MLFFNNVINGVVSDTCQVESQESDANVTIACRILRLFSPLFLNKALLKAIKVLFQKQGLFVGLIALIFSVVLVGKTLKSTIFIPFEYHCNEDKTIIVSHPPTYH